MARFYGDNGKPDDTGIKDVLSPFEADHSAVADAIKLSADGGVAGRSAILIYGFDAPERPVERVIDAFEAVAGLYVHLGPRHMAKLSDLVHPVHRSGGVFAWEVSGREENRLSLGN
jgi:hypothetical protein